MWLVNLTVRLHYRLSAYMTLRNQSVENTRPFKPITSEERVIFMISNSLHRQLQPIRVILAYFGLAPGAGMNLIICDTAGCEKPKKSPVVNKNWKRIPRSDCNSTNPPGFKGSSCCKTITIYKKKTKVKATNVGQECPTTWQTTVTLYTQHDTHHALH